MKYRCLLTAAVVASLAMTQAGFAETSKGKRQLPVRHPAPALGISSMDPPRMIEIRPGYWVSSWGCVMEDSQGRLMDCSTSGNDK